MNIPNISKLQNVKDSKKKAKIDAYNIVLNKCIEKIIYTNIHADQCFIFFDIPQFLNDFPFYDMKDCIIYIITQLQPKNYKVKFIEPFYLYIDWSAEDISHKKVKTNVIKTLHPEKLKKQTTELLKKYPGTSQIIFEYEKPKPKNKNKK